MKRKNYVVQTGEFAGIVGRITAATSGQLFLVPVGSSLADGIWIDRGNLKVQED